MLSCSVAQIAPMPFQPAGIVNPPYSSSFFAMPMNVVEMNGNARSVSRETARASASSRVCATVDVQMLPILLRSLGGRPRYDAGRHDLGSLRR